VDFVLQLRSLGIDAEYLWVGYEGDEEAHAVALVDGDIVVDWTAKQCDASLPIPSIYHVRREGETLLSWYEGQWDKATIEPVEVSAIPGA
jgi:hypothetical protein